MSIPTGECDAKESDTTTTSQAALYRLNGDVNPLHIDPQMAAMGGFDKPSLHGLCSFGIAVRQILRRYGNNDRTNVKAIKARFTAPVYPGETLETQMWQRGTRVHFQTRILRTWLRAWPQYLPQLLRRQR